MILNVYFACDGVEPLAFVFPPLLRSCKLMRGGSGKEGGLQPAWVFGRNISTGELQGIVEWSACASLLGGA